MSSPSQQVRCTCFVPTAMSLTSNSSSEELLGNAFSDLSDTLYDIADRFEFLGNIVRMYPATAQTLTARPGPLHVKVELVLPTDCLPQLHALGWPDDEIKVERLR
jgi:hypothetical protein